MSAAWLVAKVDLRRRWPSLLWLAVLVAVVAGAVLTSLVGAWRVSTSIDRFRQRSIAADVTFQAADPETGDELIARLRALDEVEVAATRWVVNAFPEDGELADIAIHFDPEDVYGTDVERPLVLDGRLPTADAADEILLNEMAARVTGLHVGDRLRMRSWSEADLAALFDATSFPGFNGPALDLEVVGIGRMPDELPREIHRTGPYAVASPAFLTGHEGIGVWPPAVMARLHDQRALPAVAEAMAPLTPGDALDAVTLVDTTASDAYAETSQQAVDRQAAGLVVVAAVAAVAGGLAIGQAFGRQLTTSRLTDHTLRVVGLTRTARATALALPMVAAGLVGVVLGVVVAIGASPLPSTGLAARAEVDRGVWIDPGTLAAGGLALAICVLVGGWLAARRAVGRSSSDRAEPRRPSALAGLVNRAGGSPTVAAGVRFAQDRSTRHGSVPVRSAAFGLALGVAGLVGAGVVAVSLDDLSDTPPRWGWPWSTTPDYFADGDIAELSERLYDDDRIDAVADHVTSKVALDDQATDAHTLLSHRGSIAFTVVEGRLPAGSGEVALGTETLAGLDRAVGDVVAGGTPDDPVELTIVGTVVLPPDGRNQVDRGAVLSPDGFEALQHGDVQSAVVLRYPAGVDVAALEAELRADYGFAFGLFTQPQLPGPIRNLGETRQVAVALGMLFAALGVIGLVHALVVSTRRRRHDLAVLRALGMRAAQVRNVVSVQALVLAAFGSVIGVPVGLVVGRAVWRELVSDLGVIAEPVVPWSVVLLIVPVLAVLAVLVSLGPGGLASRLGIARELEPE